MPSHFKFKEYCPVVFRNLRERFSIDEDMYLVRIIWCWIFHSRIRADLSVMSLARISDPKLQMGENYSYLFNLKHSIRKSWYMFIKHTFCSQ